MVAAKVSAELYGDYAQRWNALEKDVQSGSDLGYRIP